MKQERTLLIEGRKYTLLISDEPQALLEAKASGRAVLGCMSSGKTDEKATDSWDLKGIPYVILSIEYATDELAELILRRYLGLPWLIDETERLVIREFIKEDAKNIPEEEYGKEEEIFRDPDKLEAYIKNQYGFYEYGTWAVLKKAEKNAVKKDNTVKKDNIVLIGMAGVGNPQIPEIALQALPALPDGLCWLELGYHIFKTYRKNGYAKEAAIAILSYAHEVLSARLCAWIEKKNKASCALAESLGMEAVKIISGQTASGWPEGYLLYAEKMQQQPDKENGSQPL